MLNFCLYKPCAMCLSLLHFQPCAGSEPDCNCCLSNKYTYMQLRSPEVTRVNLARWLSCLHCLHCSLTARRSWVRFPHGVLLALGGSWPSVLRWAISRAFLCGVCMFSPCSHGVSSTKNPNRKTCKKNRTHLPSLTETDGSLGPRSLRSCPLLLGGPGGRTLRDGTQA